MNIRTIYKKHQDALELAKAYVGMIILSILLVIDLYYEKRFYIDIVAVVWTVLLVLIVVIKTKRSNK